jgi:signal transduction histidine kinase
VTNAINYGREAGAITVSVTRIEESVQLTVTDNGIGIDAADQKRIFDRFFRIRGAEGRLSSSNGLGLSIAKVAVEQHGGRIWVESVPGAGSTFFVQLPIDPLASAASLNSEA